MKTFFSYLLKNQFIAALLFVGVLWALWTLREILLIVFSAYIIMAALTPAVELLRKNRVPKSVAVILTFFATLAFIALLIAPIVPFLIEQIQQLFKSFPVYLSQAAQVLGIQGAEREVTQAISPQQVGQNAFAVAGGVFGGFFQLLTLLAISFYLLLDYDKLKGRLSSLFPRKHQDEVENFVTQVNDRLGAWLQGQLLLSLCIGLVTWIILTLIGIPFALPLAVLAGLLEIIPTIGPIIAAVPAVIVALTISPNMALVVIGAYVVIQALENHLLVPRIMQRAVGLNPLIVILGIIVGGQLLGVFGALLSIPFISLMIIVFNNIKSQFD